MISVYTLKNKYENEKTSLNIRLKQLEDSISLTKKQLSEIDIKLSVLTELDEISYNNSNTTYSETIEQQSYNQDFVNIED